MLARSNSLLIKYDGNVVNLPVVPLEYVLAQELCSPSTSEQFKAMNLVRIGKKHIDEEKLRGILKSIGKPDIFQLYLEIKYFI